jgi:NTE family protein
LSFFKSIQLLDVKKYARNKPGFIDTEKFYSQFKRYLDQDNFKALKKKLKITATDILHGSLKVFASGELIRPVLASAAFPGIFAPVKIGDSYFIDGGALNNFPVELIKENCDFLIGSYANWLKTVKINELKHSYNVVERAFKIKAVRDDLSKFTACDLVIVPEELGNYGTFDMKRLEEIFQLGYQSAKQALSNSKLFNTEFRLSSTIS